jgi:hypothetical protein
MTALTAREERGLVIAATQKLTQRGKAWLVPSQSGKGRYTVVPDNEQPYCSCPDFEETGGKCKHIYAVEFTMNRDAGNDGTVTETRSITFTQKRTYKQPEWGTYNLAQAEENHRFLVLLHDLCKGLNDPPQSGAGRRRSAMSDMVFTAVYKVYSTLSTRRFCTDLRDAHDKGFLTRQINGTMAWQYLESPLLTPVLKDLITVSSLPLRTVETDFAVDSSGFSTSRFVRWIDEKYGVTRSGRDWVKCHIACGVKTHVVTAAEILERDAADCPQFAPLVKKTAQHFHIDTVPADKAYLSNENLELVQQLGGMAYIPFKINSTTGEPGSLWERLYRYY